MAKIPVKVTESIPLFCARCADELRPGDGSCYRITIEAVADPTPPEVAPEDLQADLRQQIERLISQMGGISEQEAMHQVYRRLIIYLCGPCYREWIENPAG